MLCGGGCSCELTHDWDELFVYGIFGSEAADRIEQQADFLGCAGDLRAGKKYDFHRRSFEKISNFTTPEKALGPHGGGTGRLAWLIVANIAFL